MPLKHFNVKAQKSTTIDIFSQKYIKTLWSQWLLEKRINRVKPFLKKVTHQHTIENWVYLQTNYKFSLFCFSHLKQTIIFTPPLLLWRGCVTCWQIFWNFMFFGLAYRKSSSNVTVHSKQTFLTWTQVKMWSLNKLHPCSTEYFHLVGPPCSILHWIILYIVLFTCWYVGIMIFQKLQYILFSYRTTSVFVCVSARCISREIAFVHI